ncbi:U-box domain-containing protein 62-like [Mercurialis annua]|uniref:U-box domain-containing protein 62-like n=1 Tax=Mercurialis annua TaxID=3986 RepID=UPI00215E2D5A|nr:U-box domain-containing protein 62-like [Mercurialis annua]
MSAENLSLNGLNTQIVFSDDPLRFNGGPPTRRVGVGDDPVPKTTTRELAGFIDEKLFSSSSNSAAAAVTSDRFFSTGHDFPRNMYRENRSWNGDGNGHGTSGDSEDDEDDDMDEDDDEVEGGGDIGNSNGNKSNNNNTATNNTATTSTSNASAGENADKIIGNGNGKPNQHSSFGEVTVVKDGSGIGGHPGNNRNNIGVTVAERDGELYYPQYLQSNEGSGGKDMGFVENGCGFSGRKEGPSFSCESGDSLRAILSDPLTGTLMDDAMILPCGHSFGAGGIQHVMRMKVCYACSQSVTEDLIAPNLSLRAAVQAFRREEELQFYRSSKRKREKFDQGGFGDSTAIDTPRGRGVQFPFAVTDRVIIKGNKRTPQRFVGREAVVTTQCLNGWYVVKTLDNAESVKLQYRSLAKFAEDDPSTKAMASKMPPNWL